MKNNPGILTTGEVAQLFRVDTKTVARWAKDGLIPSFKTPGGHRRFRTEDLSEFFDAP
jgi:excisionase family DNA binding protein